MPACRWPLRTALTTNKPDTMDSPEAVTVANDDHHGALPAYTATDQDSLTSRIEALQAQDPEGLGLPLTSIAPLPPRPERSDRVRLLPTWRLQRDIVNAFYTAIRERQPEIVMDFISRGLVSPDVEAQKSHGLPHKALTPMLAAVAAGDASMVRLLASLGATVDGFGMCVVREGPERWEAELTPLQLAAGRGMLAIVRVLREELGADDAVVAPRGETALWLARRGGHGEVVAYLPARNEGAWLRFKSAREDEVEKLRRAVRHSFVLRLVRDVVWVFPRWLVWTVPVSLWRRRREVLEWCRRQVVKFPGRCVRAVKAVGRGIRKLPRVVEKVGRGLWEWVKAIPGALAGAFAWVARGLRSIGDAVVNAVTRVLSLLHTVFAAVADYFRTITVQDVVNGVKAVLRAVFVTFPQATWSFIAGFGDMAWEFAKKFPGYITIGLYGLGYILWYVAKWPFQACWKVLSGIGRLFARVYDELVMCYDPKRM